MKDKKTLAWIGGGIMAGLLAVSIATAKKPSEYNASISNINVEKGGV